MIETAAVKWTYEPRWGVDVAVCWVTLRGRAECWAAQTIYITEEEREEVPKELIAKLQRTIRMFGPIMEEDGGLDLGKESLRELPPV